MASGQPPLNLDDVKKSASCGLGNNDSDYEDIDAVVIDINRIRYIHNVVQYSSSSVENTSRSTQVRVID